MNFFLHVSRPRFWMYLIGPFLLGSFAALTTLPSPQQLLIIASGILFFSLPANLYLYGVNDLHDQETDKLNPKKNGYEQLLNPAKIKLLNIILTYILTLTLASALLFFEPKSLIAIFLFFFLSHFYSAPPIRAKAKPFLDMVFNALYVMPAMVGFYLLGGGDLQTRWDIVLAAIFWCMAMHAYSAVPDIESDKQAGIQTTATVLGKIGTLLLCLFLYASSAFLAFSYLSWISVVFLGVYTILIIISITNKNLLKVYSIFPYLNTAVGFALFLSTFIPLL